MSWGNIVIVFGLLSAGFVAGFLFAILIYSNRLADMCKERDWARMEARLLKNQREQN
jgi:hypothetical protein